jgi:hypothetical protein
LKHNNPRNIQLHVDYRLLGASGGDDGIDVRHGAQRVVEDLCCDVCDRY